MFSAKIGLLQKIRQQFQQYLTYREENCSNYRMSGELPLIIPGSDNP